MSQARNKPVKVLRARGVCASVFANQVQTEAGERTFHKVTVQRVYREDGQFKTSTSLGRDDLPVAKMLIGRAWEFILDAESQQQRESSAAPKQDTAQSAAPESGPAVHNAGGAAEAPFAE